MLHFSWWAHATACNTIAVGVSLMVYEDAECLFIAIHVLQICANVNVDRANTCVRALPRSPPVT